MIKVLNFSDISISCDLKDMHFSFTQGWKDYQLSKAKDVFYLVDKLNEPSFIFFCEKKSLGFKKNLLVISAAFFNASPSLNVQHFSIQAESFSKYYIVYCNLDSVYSPSLEYSFRKTGFTRPLGQFNANQTIRVTTTNLNYNRNWQRNIKKATKLGLEFRLIETPNFEDINSFCAMFEQQSKLKKLGYTLEPLKLKNILDDVIFKLFIVYQGEIPVAARIISIQGSTSYDVYAANSDLSRENGATHFLMDSIFKWLAEKEILFFDFSRIATGKKGASGVSDFKVGSNGEVTTYTGEWVYGSSFFKRLVVFIINKIVLRKFMY